MEEEKWEDRDSLNPEGEEDTLKTQEEKDNEPDKFKTLADNYKVRAEKAEKDFKALKERFESSQKEGLSQTDVITLAKADIHEDDIDEVLDFAKYKKVSVREALGSGVIKSLLAERKEERATAQATSTGNKRAGTRALSGDELLSQAIAGKVPDTKEGIEALAEARYQSKVNRKK
jgi:hypothetical protein